MLFRTSSHSGALEVELTRRNIPFVKFGGLKFLEAAHVKDVLAFLHWAQNPRDRVAGFRVLQLLPGIGPATAARVLDHLGRRASCATSTRRPAAAEAWPDFAETIEAVRRGDAGWPAELETICRWYAPHLERAYEDASLREADLAQLTQIASSYPSRERFLTEMKLDPPDATSDEAGPPLLDEDYLILSTIHSAKGQEWKAVFVLNTVDGCIPSDLSVRTAPEIEEERRLLYVAMTRARGSTPPHGAAALLRASAARTRRPPCLRAAHALHPPGDPEVVRGKRLAAGGRRQDHRDHAGRRRRRARQAAPDVGLRRRP